MKKFALGGVSVILVFCIVLQLKIIYSAYRETPTKSDVMIVLGCRLWGDQPSPMLIYRLEKALELYEQGYSQYIIVSGAQGDDEWITEAEAMKTYLVNRGVNPEHIWKEENSYNTYENLYYSNQILQQEGFDHAIIVTNGFHIHRSLMIARRLQMEVSAAPAQTYPWILARIRYYTREVLAYIKDCIIVREQLL